MVEVEAEETGVYDTEGVCARAPALFQMCVSACVWVYVCILVNSLHELFKYVLTGWMPVCSKKVLLWSLVSNLDISLRNTVAQTTNFTLD